MAASASSIGKGGYVVDYAHGEWTGFVRLNACGHCSARLIKPPAATDFIFSLLSGGFLFHLEIKPFISEAEPD
ncbi:TPA: hypothetical protein O8U57_003921 [Enterobacter asburiae]|uniref:hypothetical protein n=1 Tax=Enterobacter TaxID=547 RepID=UPI0005E660E4|nr:MULTISPECIES: hypothetical protein [Enterobacter]AMX08214.1 hypothetical protein A0R60_3989 [Enterobacter asburiae]EHN8905318.1 hypothetical protein [Enterobacter asburiae]KJI80688.1 hypothetical protein UO97_21585 [Enterobacter asburiae]KZP91366.1 hypothetical protein A3N46_16675 [Enterobacter asburiae]MBG0638228.1 hypothetical protein [Enterobacter asburiae]